MRAAQPRPALFKTPTPTRPPRRRRGRSASPGGSGSPCTRPGHTEDHLCLFDPTEGVMLSGDHVLPTITPHIGGLQPATATRCSTSSSRSTRSPPTGPTCPIVLPAHGHPFDDLAGRAKAIQEHHVDRLDLLRQHDRRARPPGPRAGAVDAPVLAAGPGADGRQRDVRPPRAPPPRRRARAPRAGPTATSTSSRG